MSPAASDSLPEQCSALGLTLQVRAGDPALPAVPEQLWRDAELMERPTRVAVLPLAPGVHRLALEHFGDYTVDLPAETVQVHRLPEPGTPVTDVLAGPVLLHALAARGVHVLHASAFVLPDGRVRGFTAESGTGKSSLAGRAMQRGWTRVADDLLALAIEDGRVRVLTGLRQPKLDETEQPATQLPTELPLCGLHLLRRVHGQAQQVPLDPAASFRLLLWATVAARVYSADSLAAHLRFANHLVAAVTRNALAVSRLDLPERPEDIDGALDEVLDLLQG